MERNDGRSRRAALLAMAWGLLADGCGAGSHLVAPDAGSRDAAPDVESVPTTDGGTEYDCEQVCAGDHPICTGVLPDGEPSTPCEVDCQQFAHATTCPLGEGVRLLDCLARNPGACEDRTGEHGCYDEWTCYQYCTDPASPVWCRPQGE